LALAYFLAGDSYPKDRHIEDALARRLGRAGVAFVSQPALTALAGAHPGVHPVPERLGQLAQVLRSREQTDPPPFLIGRSSGCVVATRAALQHRLSGVICLAYPFRRPDHEPEPARFAHLAGLRTRTLIIQGDTDQYGGTEAVGAYRLSPAVDLRFVTGRHRLELSEAGWDEVAGWILRFMAERADPTACAPPAAHA
jgi:hypothetical protein